MNIIGQDKIINKINSLTLDTFPRTLLLMGLKGSGRHLICDYISNKFHLQIKDITESLNYEMLESITLKPEPFIYLIDGSKISVKEENVILKFLEEPLKNAYIVILAETKSSLLSTILNRCQIWELEKYTKETLKTFSQSDKDLIFEIAKTPGSLKLIETQDVDAMLSLANKIFTKVSGANFSNTLTISNKIAFKNEQNLFDFNTFIEVLIYSIKCIIIDNKDKRFLEAYELTNTLSNDQYIPNINQKCLFENYLLNLRLALA